MKKIYSPTFIIDENILTIFPSRPQIERWLIYTEKAMVQGDDGDQEVERTPTPLYWVVEERPEGRVISTMQGLWKWLMVKCLERGWRPHIQDVRIEFPAPRLDLTHGLRPWQDEAMRTGLAENWSGIFSLPTRFGKTHIIANIIKAYPGLKIVVLVPGEDLGLQLLEELQALLPKKIDLIGFGSKKKTQGDGVTLCSLDSMDKLDHDDTKLILIDEVHTLVTNNRLPQFYKFINARKYGFGATSAGRFDNRDLAIEGAVGPIIAEKTFRESVALGAVAPITVFMLRVPYNVAQMPHSRRDVIYKHLLWGNDYMGRLVHAICDRVIPHHWQTLMFITSEKAALFFQGHLDEPSIAMAKLLTKKERSKLKNQMFKGDIRLCLASNIYSQGVTFPDLRVVINLAAGGANTFAVQKPGRVAQIRDGKRCGVMFDFLFEGYGKARGKQWIPQSESKSRLALYREKGYDVVVVDDLTHLPEIFKQHAL